MRIIYNKHIQVSYTPLSYLLCKFYQKPHLTESLQKLFIFFQKRKGKKKRTPAADMGVFEPPSQISFWVSFLIVILITPSLADNHDSRTTNNNSLCPPPFIQDKANANANKNFSPFKPSMAVVVGVLTTMFSMTFLLLLYAKHCKRENSVVGYGTSHSTLINPSSTNRKNSGIDRTVIESLPIFRFGALRGHKDGLECAVCLTRFEPTEVLRLLPKCKHAFHVECVDTWLDSHSTCPLCRYRVDPEDILLSFEKNIDSAGSEAAPPEPNPNHPEFRRVSGRHSSAGEFGSCSQNPTSSRRSLDGAFSKKREQAESVAVGCFDRPRKDGLLLTDGLTADRKSSERRFEHRIIISAGAGAGGGFSRRWSDVQPSDLLYLRSEMLLSDSRRFSSGSSRPSVKRQQQMLVPLALQHHTSSSTGIDGGGSENGSGAINSRSVSEITGLSRFSNSGESYSSRITMSNRNNHRQRHAGLVSRWLAWISSQSQSLPDVRSDRTTTDIV